MVPSTNTVLHKTDRRSSFGFLCISKKLKILILNVYQNVVDFERAANI